MIKIRLTRLGAKRKPFYRIVVADSRRQRDGKYIELVGTYNPKLGEVKVVKELALKWLSKGAQPTPTVRNIFSHEGILAEYHNSKSKNKVEVMTKSGQRFGKEVDLKKNYTAPGTRVKVSEKDEQAAVVDEIKEETKAEEVKVGEPKTEVVEKESKTDEVKEDPKTEEVKEEVKEEVETEEVKEEVETEEVKEETKTEEVKEEAKTEEVKEEAKTEEVKEEAKTEEVKEEAKTKEAKEEK